MNSDYYFQKGLRLIVTGVVVLALIILFCGMVSQLSLIHISEPTRH